MASNVDAMVMTAEALSGSTSSNGALQQQIIVKFEFDAPPSQHR